MPPLETHILLRTRDLRLLEMLEGASLPPALPRSPAPPDHDFLAVIPGLAPAAIQPDAPRLQPERARRRVSLA